MTSQSATPGRYPYQNEPIWSRSEKAIARKAFDAALQRELHEVMQETKKMASQINKPDDLWDLEQYLTERRKDINRKYDPRGSRLKDVLGRLLYENRSARTICVDCGKRRCDQSVLSPSFSDTTQPDLHSERYGLP